MNLFIITSVPNNQYDAAIGLSKEWLYQVNNYVSNGTVPNDFIGQCCIHQYKRLSSLKNNTLNEHDTSVPDQYKPLDGCIYFPEFSLLVDSPIDVIDIHGLGNDGIGNDTKLLLSMEHLEGKTKSKRNGIE